MIVTVISREVDLAGKHRLTVVIDGNIETVLKFQHDPSQDELNAAAQHWVDILDDIRTPKEDIGLSGEEEKLVTLIRHIKRNPNITLGQYNSFLASQIWYDAAAMRYGIYRLAAVLALRYGINMGSMTETEVLSRLKTWIENTPAKKITKIILGNNIDL